MSPNPIVVLLDSGQLEVIHHHLLPNSYNSDLDDRNAIPMKTRVLIYS
jgi:hypothetical protein